MIFYLIGISFKEAPISALEALHGKIRNNSNLREALRVKEIFLFTSCNRAEIYAIAENYETAVKETAYIKGMFFPYLNNAYEKYGFPEVLTHALRLACGIESQLAGEREILTQLTARAKELAPLSRIRVLWEFVIAQAVEIRRETGIDELRSNIADEVLEDIKGRIRPGDSKNVIIFGTGKVAKLFSLNKESGLNFIFVARKNKKKATRLAKSTHGKAILPDEVKNFAGQTSFVVCATTSPHYVIKNNRANIFKNTNGKTLYIYDLALPRDVDPLVGGLEGVVLRNLSGLQENFSKSNAKNIYTIKTAEAYIDRICFAYKNQEGRNENKIRHKAEPARV